MIDVSRAIARPSTRRVSSEKKWNVFHFGACVSFDTQSEAEAHLWSELNGEGYVSYGYPVRYR